MVRSQPESVDAYLSQASPEGAPALEKLRALARRVLPDHEERIHWGIPAYLRDDKLRFGFAERKKYLALYFMHSDAVARNADALGGLSPGKSCVRLRKTGPVDWPLIEKLLADARAGAG
ncbi:MAG TPA: DUF1801 domain-containing protein [Caulobacteraceae bacterium]|nr:DUF1801 domain-containing protein [Caulobacteraceae bacterium]